MSDSDGLPIGVAATVTLVVAALAAVGITGDFVPRMVRDEPNFVKAFMWIALAGAAVIALAVVLRGTWGLWLGFGGAIVVLVATAWAVSLGASSVADREQPRVVLSAATGEHDVVTISVDVSGAGLRPRDDMLVQVLGLKTLGRLDESISFCEQSQLRMTVKPEDGELLAWERLGPDNKGNVNGTVKVEVIANGFQGVCAFGALAPKDEVESSRAGSDRSTATTSG
jgi:hypothetical protein